MSSSALLQVANPGNCSRGLRSWTAVRQLGCSYAVGEYKVPSRGARDAPKRRTDVC